jgi:hypothetical protein
MMRAAAVTLLAATAAAVVAPETATAQTPTCAPGGDPVELDGTVAAEQARTYVELPFEVADGTTRIEVTYDWQESGPAPGQAATVIDLGLWDSDGAGSADGFRGWSGSRLGRTSTNQPPVFVQPDVAARGYHPGAIDAGTWTVDLGFGNVGPAGATWQVTVTCTDPDVGAPFEPDPVDAEHVADPDAGWYHGDFHMHGYHSNNNAPEWQEEVDTARAAGLDFLPITDYVTGQHWDELGAVQDDNPDVVIWPGREIITYFGHANALGETRSVLDYRRGFDGVSLRDIQDATLADGALFQMNHPDFFPPPLSPFCRGCFFELEGEIDLDRVDTIEVLTGPVLFSPTDLGAPAGGELLPNPFTQAAIDRWEALLLAGHRMTAVSGSDSKGVESEPDRRGWGSSATAVFAEELSRPALIDAIRAGHAYVRTRGVDGSPEVELTGAGPNGQTAIMGDTLVADTAELTVTVRGGSGQTITILRDGEPFGLPVPVTADPFTHTFTATRVGTSGPLGTFWRVDVADSRSLTAITNPIFLTGTGPAPADPAAPAPAPAAVGGTDQLPRTGGAPIPLALVAVALAGGGAALLRRARR